MTDRPIIISAPMVRALLEGRKTQTRRVLTNVPMRCGDTIHASNIGRRLRPAPYLDSYRSGPRTPANPRGMSEDWCWWTRDNRPAETFKVRYVPGDRLWVCEAWAVSTFYDDSRAHEINPEGTPGWCGIRYAATDKRIGIKDRPSIHMPRWASRITLLVTNVRVQRLQDISEEDARAEGISCLPLQDPDDSSAWWQSSPGVHQARTPGGSYRLLWNSLHGPDAWSLNPWVAALAFRTICANIDAPEAKAA